MQTLKNIFRSISSVLAWHLYFRWIKSSWSITRDGKPLKKGITAVISAKNEEYTLPLCLKSLIGIADQVVCIDNGSDDRTWEVMEQFKKEYGKQIEVDIVQLPGALLGDCREKGLELSRYTWHLRWDADMVCKTHGQDSMMNLREDVMSDDRPRAIKCPRTNLLGDFYHTERNLAVVDDGEHFMVRFGKHVKYTEFGRFDAIRIPFYCKIVNNTVSYIFHLQGLKSIENLMYRNAYFDWRETVNKVKDEKGSVPPEIENFDQFNINRNEQIFQTNEINSLKYRFMRYYAANRYQKFDYSKYGPYPEAIQEAIDKGDERFEVVYQNDKPFFRWDREDPALKNYQPSEADLAWAEEKVPKR